MVALTLAAAVSVTGGSARAAGVMPCPPGSPRAAADAYLDAIVSHDASAVPLAPDAHRIEDGLLTGTSGPGIRADLDTSPKFWIVADLRDRTYVTTRTTAEVHYLLDVGYGGFRLLTVQIQERFVLSCGAIDFIDAVITPA
jgi:hypothetical protein